MKALYGYKNIMLICTRWRWLQ